MDWRVHLNDSSSAWALDQVEVTIFRQHPGGDGEQLIGWDDGGRPITELVPSGHVLKHGFMVPREALDSLRDQLKPGPSEGELKLMAEALETERRRVDEVIGRLCPHVFMPEVQGQVLDAVLESTSDAERGAELLDRDAVRGVARRVRTLRRRIEDGLASGHSRDLDLMSLAEELEALAGPA